MTFPPCYHSGVFLIDVVALQHQSGIPGDIANAGQMFTSGFDQSPYFKQADGDVFPFLLDDGTIPVGEYIELDALNPQPGIPNPGSIRIFASGLDPDVFTISPDGQTREFVMADGSTFIDGIQGVNRLNIHSKIETSYARGKGTVNNDNLFNEFGAEITNGQTNVFPEDTIDADIAIIGQDAAYWIIAHAIGVSGSGEEAAAKEIRGLFRREGSSNPVQVGATEVISSRDSLASGATFDFDFLSPASLQIQARITVTSGTNTMSWSATGAIKASK